VNISEINYTTSAEDSCWYSNDNGISNSTIVSAGTNFTNIISIEGSNTWIVWCNNSQGYEENDFVTFWKDTIIPAIIWENPTPDDGATTLNDWVYLNATINDNSDTSAFFDWNYSLAGYWAMDFYNTTGAYDNSSYDNFGDFIGGLGPEDVITGRYGKALEFDGINDYIKVSNPDSLNFDSETDFSVCYWAYRNNTPSSKERIIDRGSYSWSFGWHTNFGGPSSRYLMLELSDGSGAGNQLFSSVEGPINTWTHICYVINKSSKNISLYLQGMINTSETYTDDNNFSSDPGRDLAIGAYYAGDEYFKGKLDEVRFYSRALSPEEIKASYDNSQYRLEHNFTGLSNSEYNYSAYTIDKAGNLNISKRNVTVYAGPAIDITYPLNTSYAINVSELNHTASSAEYCWYSTDNGASNSTAVAAGQNFTGIISLEGSNSWTIWCNDSLARIKSNSVTFWKDTTPPDISQDNITVFNESGIEGVVKQGDKVTFNVTDGGDYDSVWIIIWQGIAGLSDILFQDFLILIDNVWTITIGTNLTWPIGEMNYTIYVNDTFNHEANISGNFTMLEFSGSVDNCKELNMAGQTYYLSQDITGSVSGCINISANNITLNCQDNAIIGDGIADYGIYINRNTKQITNITIKNCNVSNWSSAGVYIDKASGNNITNNVISKNINNGFHIKNSDNNIIASNIINNNSDGYGLLIESASYNNLTNNTASSNSVTGFRFNGCTYNNISDNIAKNNIGYRGFSIRENSDNNQFINNIAENNENDGFWLEYSDNNTLRNNTAISSKNYNGIALTLSNFNIIADNNASGNNGDGISLSSSTKNILANNTAMNNTDTGFLISYSNNTELTNNFAYSNDDGILIYSSSHNLIQDSNLSSNINTVLLQAGSLNNTFLNCSYDFAKESVETDCRMSRKWYYQAFASYTNGTVVEGANITARNVSTDSFAKS
jgi:parallel beta-helix repeat protein